MDDDFEKGFEILISEKKIPNFTDKKQSQRLNDNFVNESRTLFQDFGNFNNIIKLNERKQIKSYGDWNLALNYNSFSFLRDTNYSLSLVSKDKEIAIIGFFPVSNKIIRIVQLQGQKGYEPEDGLLKDWKQILIDELKVFVNGLGFKKLEILRGEKNYLFKFPKNLKEHENFNLEEHQNRMLYIYNVLPIRKWGFKYKKGDWYSTFSF